MQSRHLLSFAAAAALIAIPAAAVAQSAAKAIVDSAKAAGIVGEQADGFLGLVTGQADPAVKAAVAEINAGRLALYREAAAKNGVTPEAAGSSAFQGTVMGLLKPGQFYKPAGGGWVKK
jgi:uncharacterized protein YdbL (DUF1318 family)